MIAALFIKDAFTDSNNHEKHMFAVNISAMMLNEIERTGFKCETQYNNDRTYSHLRILTRIWIHINAERAITRNESPRVRCQGSFYYFNRFTIENNKLSFYMDDKEVFFMYGGVRSLYY
tara:strand:+ start:317 stop:673 length:357 start_codon:yes stop_codon:yes gene_type:complete